MGAGRVGRGQRVVGGAPQTDRARTVLGERDGRRRTDGTADVGAVVAVELLVVGAGGSLLVGAELARANADRSKFVEDQTNDTRVLGGQILVVELVLEGNELVGAMRSHRQERAAD